MAGFKKLMLENSVVWVVALNRYLNGISRNSSERHAAEDTISDQLVNLSNNCGSNYACPRCGNSVVLIVQTRIERLVAAAVFRHMDRYQCIQINCNWGGRFPRETLDTAPKLFIHLTDGKLCRPNSSSRADDHA